MATPEINQTAVEANEQKAQASKEYNFRQIEQRFMEERNARMEAERRLSELSQQRQASEEDDESEPYVDHKKLNKKLISFEKTMEQRIEQKAELIAKNMVEKEKQKDWIKRNPDFMTILEKHANQFEQFDPELADSIMQIPDPFERQKLVYKNIKALKLDEPPKPQSTIQEKVDANRRSPFYQPSGIASAPYSAQGDFSATGQQQAYQKMKELQSKLRLK